MGLFASLRDRFPTLRPAKSTSLERPRRPLVRKTIDRAGSLAGARKHVARCPEARVAEVRACLARPRWPRVCIDVCSLLERRLGTAAPAVSEEACWCGCSSSRASTMGTRSAMNLDQHANPGHERLERRLPLIILAGSDREAAVLPPSGRGKHSLIGHKAIDVQIHGR